jgi:hypothetical protein
MSDERDRELIAARREQFFRYFRARVRTVSDKTLPLPDRVILLTACLDALANHWHSTTDATDVHANIKADERLREFLLCHGQHPIFERVSAPLIRNAIGKEVGSFQFGDYTPGEYNRVQDWSSDPTFADLWTLDGGGELQRRWSYAGILYVDLRCAWVHRFAPENEHIRILDENSFERDEPFYRLVVHSTGTPTYMLVIPFAFLLQTLDRAITSFENDTAKRSVLPFKE